MLTSFGFFSKFSNILWLLSFQIERNSKLKWLTYKNTSTDDNWENLEKIELFSFPIRIKCLPWWLEYLKDLINYKHQQIWNERKEKKRKKCHFWQVGYNKPSKYWKLCCSKIYFTTCNVIPGNVLLLLFVAVHNWQFLTK